MSKPISKVARKMIEVSYLSKTVKAINNLDPVAREVVINRLRSLYPMHKLFLDNPDEFAKKYGSVKTIYDMEDEFENWVKDLLHIDYVPMWQLLYFEICDGKAFA